MQDINLNQPDLLSVIGLSAYFLKKVGGSVSEQWWWSAFEVMQYSRWFIFTLVTQNYMKRLLTKETRKIIWKFYFVQIDIKIQLLTKQLKLQLATFIFKSDQIIYYQIQSVGAALDGICCILTTDIHSEQLFQTNLLLNFLYLNQLYFSSVPLFLKEVHRSIYYYYTTISYNYEPHLILLELKKFNFSCKNQLLEKYNSQGKVSERI
ncbi:Hypothetical_protein [Hexamita inflata]|uniref:Hypothetical_protein n=1 Tax=Hexamita inflata TaxID=28002 RepID=A0AA86RCB8_9EUKA|nr:Hypothetical protein HINF_LOCUS63274 [Hexamita inflata]